MYGQAAGMYGAGGGMYGAGPMGEWQRDCTCPTMWAGQHVAHPSPCGMLGCCVMPATPPCLLAAAAVGAGPFDPNDPNCPPQPPSAWQAMLHAVSGGWCLDRQPQCLPLLYSVQGARPPEGLHLHAEPQRCLLACICLQEWCTSSAACLSWSMRTLTPCTFSSQPCSSCWTGALNAGLSECCCAWASLARIRVCAGCSWPNTASMHGHLR